MRRIVAIPLIFASFVARADDKIDVAKGVEQAKAMSKAFFEEDYAKVVDATHPKLVEILGGKEKWLDTMKSDVQKVKDMGVKFKVPSVGKPGDPVVDGKTAYLIIPTSMEMTTPDETIISESYLLGMTTDAGKTWVFVDGVGISHQVIRDMIFPKLPDGLKLPVLKEPLRKMKESGKDKD
jgi:hypothetical protein